MKEMNLSISDACESLDSRALPVSIDIPEIRGEMAKLRPATLDDLSRMDDLHAFDSAALITGKDSQSERTMVHAWVERSVQWSKNSCFADDSSNGCNECRFSGDVQSCPTIAWAIVPDVLDDEENKSASIIGMIFLIDIDGWARSARIQVVLGRDYRGRGYSRDAMPRVMTYGFASLPVGLGMHRIWVGVPATNTRSLSVYQSLGFMRTGTARDALWDSYNQKYQDFVVMDTLADEYDAIRSLDAFGLHVIEENPGVREALSAHEHSIAVPIKTSSSFEKPGESKFNGVLDHNSESFDDSSKDESSSNISSIKSDSVSLNVGNVGNDVNVGNAGNYSNDGNNSIKSKKQSKRAWWRFLGRDRNNHNSNKWNNKSSDNRNNKISESENNKLDNSALSRVNNTTTGSEVNER